MKEDNKVVKKGNIFTIILIVLGLSVITYVILTSGNETIKCKINTEAMAGLLDDSTVKAIYKDHKYKTATMKWVYEIEDDGNADETYDILKESITLGYGSSGPEYEFKKKKKAVEVYLTIDADEVKTWSEIAGVDVKDDRDAFVEMIEGMDYTCKIK